MTDGELDAATLAMSVEENADPVSTNFTCGTHFYEEVEDTKDSVWVVQVVCDRHGLFMQHDDWKAFVKKVSRFGVRTGIFDCSLDSRYLLFICVYLLICLFIYFAHRVTFQHNKTDGMVAQGYHINPLDAWRRLADFAQTSYAAGSLLTDCTVYERVG